MMALLRPRTRSGPRMCDNNLDDHCPFCPGTDEERENLLRTHYLYLCHHIRARKFFTHLKAQNVLDVSDQEEILNRHHTEVSRAEALLDLIITRGKQGFTEFITALEYLYPEEYQHITDLKARPKPHEWVQRMSSVPTIMSFLQHIEQMMSKGQQETGNAKQQIQAMRSSISAKEEDATKEFMDLQEKLLESESKSERMSKENEALKQQLAESKKSDGNQKSELSQLQMELSSLNSKLKIAKGEVYFEREKSKRYTEKEAFIVRSGNSNDADPLSLVKVKYETEIAEANTTIGALQNKVSVQESEIEHLKEQVNKTFKELKEAKDHYDVLEDDYNKDKRQHEEDTEKQNMAFRVMQDLCRKLQGEKSAMEQQLGGLQGGNHRLQPLVVPCTGDTKDQPYPRPRTSPLSADCKRPQAFRFNNA